MISCSWVYMQFVWKEIWWFDHWIGRQNRIYLVGKQAAYRVKATSTLIWTGSSWKPFQRVPSACDPILTGAATKAAPSLILRFHFEQFFFCIWDLQFRRPNYWKCHLNMEFGMSWNNAQYVNLGSWNVANGAQWSNTQFRSKFADDDVSTGGDPWSAHNDRVQQQPAIRRRPRHSDSAAQNGRDERPGDSAWDSTEAGTAGARTHQLDAQYTTTEYQAE